MRRGPASGMLAVVLGIAMALCACVGRGDTSSGKPINVGSVCELATKTAAFNGRLVRFRSGFDVAVEHVRVVDSRCPGIMVFLHSEHSGVDLTLCTEKDQRFGCPVNPDLEVRATFTGVFRGSKGGGIVDLISMDDLSSSRVQNNPDVPR